MAVTPDMADTTPGQISFADIERDLERTNFSCANGTKGCHGTATPTGVMKLTQNASLDATSLMGNYQEVLMRVNTAMPDQSLILQKTLITSTVSHAGIKPFDTAQDATYKRWLLWIQLGAHFEPVPTTVVGDM